MGLEDVIMQELLGHPKTQQIFPPLSHRYTENFLQPSKSYFSCSAQFFSSLFFPRIQLFSLILDPSPTFPESAKDDLSLYGYDSRKSLAVAAS